MHITWLGHSGFRIEIGTRVLLVDPWLSGNPSFPEDRHDDAIRGTTHILLSHGHGDHASNVLTLARDLSVPILCVFELAERWSEEDGVETMGFGKGGTLDLGGVQVTMVNASHSSSLDFDGFKHAGSEAGFMIHGEGRTIYFSGDTDIMADMDWMGDYHKPQIGILCCGGHFTMDCDRAAYAAKRYFNFETIIPCHYGTFDILAQSADPLRDAMPDGVVKLPAVMETLTF